jgi:hypothetical protein
MLHKIVDEISSKLEIGGHVKEAYQLDVVANTLEKMSYSGFDKDLEEFNVPLLMKRLDLWKTLSKDSEEKKKVAEMEKLIQESKLVPVKIPGAKVEIKKICDSIK